MPLIENNIAEQYFPQIHTQSSQLNNTIQSTSNVPDILPANPSLEGIPVKTKKNIRWINKSFNSKPELILFNNDNFDTYELLDPIEVFSKYRFYLQIYMSNKTKKKKII